MERRTGGRSVKMQPRYMVVIYDAMGRYEICECDSDEE